MERQGRSLLDIVSPTPGFETDVKARWRLS